MPVASGLYYFSSGADNLLYPPAILIHGAGGQHLFWPAQLRRLHDQRIFAPDLPGHGKSTGLGHHTIADYVSVLLEFIRSLNLSTVVLVGHSMGGAIALDFAAREPRRVLGLVLVGSGARLRVAPDLLRTTSAIETFPEAVRLLTERSFAPRTDARLKELAARRLAETRPPVLHGDLLACDAFDASGRLAAIAAPTLIVCGAADQMTAPVQSAYLREHIAGSRLEMVPDAGHMVMLEKPEVVAQLLSTFLDSITYQPGR
jgi:pimeloyl-ACP methyl ester carboxylesterase